MLAPILIVGAVGLLPLSRGLQITVLGRLCRRHPGHRALRFWRAPRSAIPMSRCALPPIRDPRHSMVLMTGEAPMGYMVPQPSAWHSGAAHRRLDGAARRRQRSSPRQMRARVASIQGGDLYLIADANEMGRAARRAGRIWPRHPLDRMPAIRHQHGRPLPMVPLETSAGEGAGMSEARADRRSGALLQRGSRHRQGGARLPRRAAGGARSIVYDNNSSDQHGGRGARRPAPSCAARPARAKAMWCAACSPTSKPTSMCWWTATTPMTPPRRRMIASELVEEGYDVVSGQAHRMAQPPPIAPAMCWATGC